MREGMRIHRDHETRRCPYCHTKVGMGGDQVQICETCNAWHHMECWAEAGSTCSASDCSLQKASTSSKSKASGFERPEQRLSLLRQLVQALLSTFRETKQEERPQPEVTTAPAPTTVTEEAEQEVEPRPKTREELEQEQARIAYVLFSIPTVMVVGFELFYYLGWITQFNWLYALIMLWFFGLIGGWHIHPKLPNP